MDIEQPHSKSLKEIFESFKTSKEGLTSKEVSRRLDEQGENVLFEEKKLKSLRLLVSQFKNFFVILLLVASALSFGFESATNGAVLLAVALLNVGISFIQERKAENTVESLRNVYPEKIEVVRDGKSVRIPVRELVLGDVVVLREGAAVPADLRLFEVSSLGVDEAALTGESAVSQKSTTKLPADISLGDRKNMAFAGTLVSSGEGKGVVVGRGSSTELGRIASFVQEQEERSLLLERISHLGVWLVGISAFLALVIFGLEIWVGGELFPSINFAIAVFVSAVPESLPTITTLALAVSALRLSKKKALVRHLPTVESLSGINLFAFDKTGTLTLNEMSVARIRLPKGEFRVSGRGFSSKGDVFEGDEKIDVKEHLELRKFIEAGALSSPSNVLPAEGEDRWIVRGDPTEGAFSILAKKVSLQLEDRKLVEDFAFTSKRRMRARVLTSKEGVSSYSLGAPEEILSRSTYIFKGGRKVRFNSKAKSEFEDEAKALAEKGYRVLAVADKTHKKEKVSQKEAENGLTFLGLGALLDKPKENVAETFSTLKQAGVRPVIITGDHPGTALAVARSVGLKVSKENVLSGAQLDTISEEDLLEVIPEVAVFARISPTQKYRLVSAFKELGLRVAVSGDGVNDAPALKKADVGVVMGEKGTDVSREAADLVILDDKIETILPAISEARTLYDNIKKFFTFLLSGNFEELLIIVAALILGLPQPFTTIQILWVNFITDAFPAFALAYDPPSGDTLRTKPRDLSSKMIRPVLLYALFLGLISLIGEAFFFVSYLPDIKLARTMLLTSAVLFELFIVFSIRTPRPFWQDLGSNRYLIFAFFGSLLLHVLAVHFLPLSEIMGTVPLNVGQWSVIGAFVVLSLGVAEVFKKVFKWGISS